MPRIHTSLKLKVYYELGGNKYENSKKTQIYEYGYIRIMADIPGICAAAMGYTQEYGNYQGINIFPPGCVTPGVVHHEMLHGLGLELKY